MPNVFKMKIRNCKKKKITSLNPLLCIEFVSKLLKPFIFYLLVRIVNVHVCGAINDTDNNRTTLSSFPCKLVR